MTDIQIRYWAHQENVRHNLATEQLQYETLGETARSNRANEAISLQRNQIQQQYNVGYLSELNRSNVARETETHRHNVATEGIQNLQAKASMLSASAAMKQANTQERLADSTIALNVARADESAKRAGLLAQQTETEKHGTTIAQANAKTASEKAQSVYNNSTYYGMRQGIDLVSSATQAIGNIWSSKARYNDKVIGGWYQYEMQ